MGLLQPDRYFSRISAIDIPLDIVGRGFECVLLDIDNTIRSRADHQVPLDVKGWLEALKVVGVKPCLLSNNFHANVHELSDELDIPVVGKAMKPLPHGYMQAMKLMGETRSTTVVVGDQLLTDILGAHLLGICTYMVLPLAEVDLKHTVVMRQIEQMVLRSREPEENAGIFGPVGQVGQVGLAETEAVD